MKKIAVILLGISLSLSLFASVNKTVDVTTSGTLYSLLTSDEINTISNLTITGTIDARDFTILRDSLKMLDTLDLSGATIESYTGSGGTDIDFDSFSYLANEIPNSAFTDAIHLKSIILPVSTTSISDYAFYDCSSLPSIIIPSTVTSIGKNSFEECSILRTIDLPSSVTSLGESAFKYCDGLQTVNLSSSLRSISNNAFEECGNLSQVTIPSSIKTIGEYSFSYCNNLTTITIPSSVDSIYDNAFNECGSLRSITVPSTVKYIGSEAFSYCRSLQSFDLPSSLSRIPDFLFEYCDSLQSVTIPPSIKFIGYWSFYNCKSLKAVIIPSSVDTIDESAFKHCASLKTITIPSSVTCINKNAFADCDSLLSVSIPNSVTTLGDEAFAWCPSLLSVTIPSSITAINYRMFYNCTQLKTVTIPSSVLSIGESAFEECDSLKNVSLPSSIKNIGSYAFYDCTGLQTINIPNSVVTIGSDAFQNVTLKTLVAFTGPNIIDDDKLQGDTLYIPQGTTDAYIKSNNYDFKVIKEFEACVASVDKITIPGQVIKPTITFTADTVICPGQKVTITAPNATSYLWSTKDTTQSITVSTTNTYSLTVINQNGCMSNAQEKVTIHQPFAEQIKIATFNKTSDAIIIAWTPTKGKQIASYALQLLEDVSGKFKTIATRGIADSSFVVDKKSNVLIQTYSYQLISYDSICHDSAISDTHETIHLSCSQGTNSPSTVELGWNTYMGLKPLKYEIYVYNGDSVIDSFPYANNGNSTFLRSYEKHKAGNTYRIVFDLASPVYTGTLKSDSGPFSQSLSNMAESQLTDTKIDGESTIQLYPNPASERFSLSLKESAHIALYSLTGQLLLNEHVFGNEQISLHAIKAGMYIAKIETAHTVITRILVVEK
jgi:hypothetical protein